jgi:hypothetical protein
MTVYENITLKPKPSSSTNKFQKNNTENSIAINNVDSKQTIKRLVILHYIKWIL